jgi:hypothetical protein
VSFFKVFKNVAIIFLVISQLKKKWDSSSTLLHILHFLWSLVWFCVIQFQLTINIYLVCIIIGKKLRTDFVLQSISIIYYLWVW